MENPGQISLAPAAGAGIGKLLADSLLADPEFVPLMRKTAVECLAAMAPRRWDRDTESWIADPDFRVRAQMFFGLLAHMEGEPVKRIIHVGQGYGLPLDPLASLRESPAMQDELRRLLAKADFRTSGRQAHKRPAKKAIEVVDDSEPSQSQ